MEVSCQLHPPDDLPPKGKPTTHLLGGCAQETPYTSRRKEKSLPLLRFKYRNLLVHNVTMQLRLLSKKKAKKTLNINVVQTGFHCLEHSFQTYCVTLSQYETC